MILISHRGNINGKFESYENEPNYIDTAIQNGFDVEVDVWYIDGILFLGHDKPQFGVDFTWFANRINKLWIHCKNLEIVEYFYILNKTNKQFNYFWHQQDDVTLTSLGYIWAYPGRSQIKNKIVVLPELQQDDITNCVGICSDHIKNYSL